MTKNLLAAIAVASASLLGGCAYMDKNPNTPQRTVGEAVDDAKILTEMKAKLAGDPDLSALKINVDSTQGEVRLRGEVKTLALRQKAERIAREIKGVKSVRNELVITG